MITKTELQEILQSTETYRVERTTSTGVSDVIAQDYHFPDVRKTIPMPKGAEKEIDDILLTRYAC